MSTHSTSNHRPQSPPRRQRACLPCTKAKARCHYENNETNDGCNRCRRLKTHCSPQTTKSLRRPRQVKRKDALGSEGAVVNGLLRDNSLLGPAVSVATMSGPVPSSREKNHEIPLHLKPLQPELSTSHRPPSNPGFGISWDQAQKALDDFTLIFTAHFPFIILDHDITAQRLSVEKPLLFRAILMIAIDFTTSKCREIQRSIDAWIGQHLLVMEEQSLDTLQGLIVYITWTNPHFYSDYRATQLIYLAVGIAHSLGITKQPSPDVTPAKKEAEINEEHRAFLACYYILSFNSFQFGRPNPLSSSYVQDCVDSLERSAELATDFILIKLVKFRQFIGRVPTVYQGLCDMKWCREISEDVSEQLDEIRKDLDDFMSDISYKHPKLLLLWNLHRNALIQLHLPMTYATPDTEGCSRLRLECLGHCLQASRTFTSMAKFYSPDGFLYAPFTTLVDMISMLIAISRLLLVNIDGWDLREARKTIDLKAGIDEVLVKMKAADEVKRKRVEAAAAANPSSYSADGPDEQNRDRIRIFVKLVEEIRDWLGSQGLFLSDDEEPDQNSITTNPQTSTMGVYASPQSPQWNFTFFFDSLLRIEQSRLS